MLARDRRLFVLPETIERFQEIAVAHRGKPGNADIDADGGGCLRHRLFDLPRRLEAHKPLARRQTHRGISHFTQYVPALAVA